MRYDQYTELGTFFASRCLDCSVEMAVMEGSDLTLLENSHRGGPSQSRRSWFSPGAVSARLPRRNDWPLRKLKKRHIMTLNIRPLGDRILVEAVEEKEVKKGGIIIPDTAKEKPMESRVVALGTGKTDDNGKKVPFEMKKGDRLLVTKYGGTEIKLEGKEYKILSSEDVLAVLE
jgi:chaperonin GroES